MRELTLLLLSGGGHTGANVMASVASRRGDMRLVATSDVPDEPALFGFDAVYLAPKIAVAAAAFERRILEIVRREDPDLVIPCRDEDVEWLAGLYERRRDLGAKLLCGSPDIAAVINDKWQSCEFAAKHELPFAPSLPCAEDDDSPVRVARFVREHGLPIVAKPRRGMDSKGVFILTTQAQAQSAMMRPDYLLQKYLGRPETPARYLANVEREGIPLIHSFEGVKRSLQVLIGPGGGIQHVVCTHNRRDAPNARVISTDADAESRRIGEQCASVFAEAGWRGPLNIQCLPSESGTLMIHEFNARFTGATGARWLIGHDEIGSAIRAFTGRDVAPAFPWSEAPTRAIEGLMPRAADPQWVRALSERGEWTRESR